jgi:WD40 repeat protein
MARAQALKEKRQSDLLAVSLNAAVRSQSITEPDLQSLIARQAYQLYLEYTRNSVDVMDPEANHPYLFTALRQSLRNLAPEIPLSIKAHDGSINDILMAPDGRTFYTAGSDGTVKIWAVDQWNRIGAPDVQANALLGVDKDVIYNSLSLSKNKNNLLIGGQDNVLQLYNFPEGFVKENFLLPNSFNSHDKVYVTAFKDPADSTEAMAITKSWYYTTPGALSSKSIYRKDFFERKYAPEPIPP